MVFEEVVTVISIYGALVAANVSLVSSYSLSLESEIDDEVVAVVSKAFEEADFVISCVCKKEAFLIDSFVFSTPECEISFFEEDFATCLDLEI